MWITHLKHNRKALGVESNSCYHHALSRDNLLSCFPLQRLPKCLECWYTNLDGITYALPIGYFSTHSSSIRVWVNILLFIEIKSKSSLCMTVHFKNVLSFPRSWRCHTTLLGSNVTEWGICTSEGYYIVFFSAFHSQQRKINVVTGHMPSLLLPIID